MTARILNNQFVSVFSEDDGSSPDTLGVTGTEITKITVTRNGVVKLLKDLNPNKASGPDVYQQDN